MMSGARFLGLVLLATGAQGKIYFSETFGEGWESRWTKSTWKESEGKQGEWKTATGKWFADEKEDTGIQTTTDEKFYGISAGFDSWSNKGKDLIIQYQVKYEKEMDCGGGYLKLGPKLEDGKTFGDPTPYHVMFGPDKCGYTSRTHLIFTYKGKNVLKTSDLSYKQDGVGMTHLYTMILKPDNTVRVEVDQEKIYEGSIKDDWKLLKDKTISDPDDKKPDNWVEEAMMDDPEDKKPEDWVTEKRIRDDEATKPEDWDDEEDGEWEAPMKDNPAFKGEWYVKRISNPEYKGIWKAKDIDNPEYVDDENCYAFEDIAFIGFDLWQVKSETIFDNVIVTDDKAEADEFAKKWKTLSDKEKEKKKEADDEKKKKDDEAAKDDKKDDDDDDDDDKDDDDKDDAAKDDADKTDL